MGWGLPASIGACIAHGKKRVICLAGDGGFQMTIQELATVMHNRLPIKIFVYNNDGYLTIKQSQEVGFEGRVMGCNAETGLSFPNFVKVGEAYSIKSVRIDSQMNLREQIQVILNEDGPVLCELTMDPDQPQIPKAIPRRRADGTSIQTALEDMYPYLDRDELKENMISENMED